MTLTLFVLQVTEGIQAVQENMPSSWIDEPHEKILWALVSALIAIVSTIITYIVKQLFDRRKYTEHTREAAEKLANPRSDRTINGKTNSDQLLNYMIDDHRELRSKVDAVAQEVAALRIEVKALGEKL